MRPLRNLDTPNTDTITSRDHRGRRVLAEAKPKSTDPMSIIPKLDHSHYSVLAEQLGLPVDTVKRSFSRHLSKAFEKIRRQNLYN